VHTYGHAEPFTQAPEVQVCGVLPLHSLAPSVQTQTPAEQTGVEPVQAAPLFPQTPALLQSCGVLPLQRSAPGVQATQVPFRQTEFEPEQSPLTTHATQLPVAEQRGVEEEIPEHCASVLQRTQAPFEQTGVVPKQAVPAVQAVPVALQVRGVLPEHPDWLGWQTTQAPL
jgi:hypothetical protein